MVQNQKDAIEEFDEEQTKKPKDPPNDPPLPLYPEGRKLYATRFGEKYHYKTDCKGFNGNSNFEKTLCQRCKERTKQILEEVIGSSSSSHMPNSDLGFEVPGRHYHEQNCAVYQSYKGKDKKTICYICLNEERMMTCARNRRNKSQERKAK